MSRVAAKGARPRAAHQLHRLRQRLQRRVRQVQQPCPVEVSKVLARLGQLGGHEVEGGADSRVGRGEGVQRRPPRLHARLGRAQVARLQVQQCHMHAQVEERGGGVQLPLQLGRAAAEEGGCRARLRQPGGHGHRDVGQLQLVQLGLEVGDEAGVEAHQRVVARGAEGGRPHHLLQPQRQLVPQPPLVQVRQLAQHGRQVRPLAGQLAQEGLRRGHRSRGGAGMRGWAVTEQRCVGS